MSYRNTTLAHIMEMGNRIMTEPSGDPNLAKFNLVTKIMVMLANTLPNSLANKDLPAWANAWRLAAVHLANMVHVPQGVLTVMQKVLFMLVWCAEGQGKRVRMPMGDVRTLAGGKVQYTGMLVEWEVHGRTGGGPWRMFLDEELADLKAAMERTLGKMEEVDTLFDHDRIERKSSGFTLVNHTNAFNCAVHELICLSAVAPPLLGGHALLPTALVESTAEWRSKWETWTGGLFQALQDVKEQGDCLEILYDVSQAIAMAEMNLTNKYQPDMKG
ncbi:hypothetical protein PAXINDRAFT_19366 [Paxillus involutus ATCC 200175]|uniref:Uncharacterized protein n=1 Tax=Paxillus involutus ATCC 200175 TaxID=664439 RepID=A0A0C9TJC1_PAXIN|nr:hypothetical protein PAXINDRAFT_19366 [Paxillus involutus ATCC 200175]